MNDEKLSALREQIDEIDRELVELFQKRMRAAERIAEVKISANLPLSDTTRERQVIETAVSRADNENISDTAAFMQWLINISKNRQRLCASRASGADFSSNSDNRYTIAIIGLGLIGGSLAYALSGFRNARIIGVDTNEQTRSLALTREAVDRATDDVREAVTCADLVILCLHPEQTVSVVKENAEYFKSGVFVTDVCGVKEPIVQRVRSLLPDGVAYVPCHPMAGKESGGFENARPDLFLGVGFAITPLEDTSREDIDFVEKLARYIGAEHIKCVTPSEHDALIAYTS
ncbi:MAG: prephenate dehydrogenase/arogenate dehydrogenase family protein, partial [Oscillospiraceae bacterium]|nr:prephenate dehydrogenase/arogenate dehydrogenase family protein [Oscillospiraceae bacterium]